MKWRSAALVIAGAVMAGAAYFGFFFYRDNFSTHYPLKVLSTGAFRSAEVPYWNFADGGGQPLAGNPNALTFYPDNVLYLFLPPHVAFNLHFLIHLAAAWMVMRRLSRSEGAAVIYVLSGVVISATAFYNLVPAVALIPLAFLAVQWRSAPLLGAACGLLGLAGEPLTIVATAIALAIVAFRRMAVRDMVLSFVLALVIASPQLIAYSEIAGEVERSVGMSARTVLNASLQPSRLVEMFVWPVTGFLNDAGGPFRARLFSTVFIGIIALPAMARRSRYTAVALVMLFFALGRSNPLVAYAVEHISAIRIVRYPEKFVLPMTAAIAVLIGDWLRRTRRPRVWIAVTLAPLLFTAWRALPIDWFAPYRVQKTAPRRVYVSSDIPAGAMDARDEYHLRARRLEPLFGATAGLRYVITRSPEGMHALRSRMVLERFAVVPPAIRGKYLRAVITRPPAFFPSSTAAGRNIYEEAALFERVGDTRTVVPVRQLPTAAGTVLRYREDGQAITIDVRSPGEALLVVNQTYFRAWVARAAGRELATVPADVDRLGVVVPAGQSTITLRFGRRHAAVALAWVASLLLLLAAAFVEIRNRFAGEVERAGDEHHRLG